MKGKQVLPTQVGVRQFRNQMAEWLDRVRSGEEFVITERGVPVARVSPAGRSAGLQRLIDEGLVTPPKRPKRPSNAYPTVTPKGSVTDLFLEENR